MDWKHYQTVDPLQKEPQVGRGLFGIRVLILHFKFQFSKSVKSSTFHIFLNLTYPLRKNLSFPKHLKITQKFTQNCQIVDNVISIGIWRRLKRDRDIGRKAVLSDVKTAFTFTPALIIKKLKFVLLTCLLSFLATKGSRVLEEKINETEVSKTVFSHFKAKNCTNTLITYFENAVYIDSLAEWLERRSCRFKSRSDNQLVLLSVLVPGSHSHATIV